MDSRRVIAAQNRARERAQRLEKTRAQGRLPARPSKAHKPAKGGAYLLPLLTMVLIAVVGSYWHIYGSPFQLAMTPSSMASLGQDMLPISDRHVNKRFDMGGVQLGMTPGMVRRLYPSTKMSAGRDGEQVLTIATPRGMLVAWLTDNDKLVEVDGDVYFNERKRVYRMRLDEAYADLSEQDLIKTYGRAYGRPIEAKCERNQLGDTPRCTYRWWGGNGIELTAIMKRKVDPNGKPYVLLTTIATDTQKSAQQATRFPLRTSG